jgi:lysozyme-like protein/LysM domain-containing protein
MFLVPLVMAANIYSHVHVVVPGDTLYGISQEMTGDGYKWPQLYAANRNVVGNNPNLIYPGERIVDRFIPTTMADAKPVIHALDHTSAIPIVTYHGSLSGTLSCSGLEHLWDSAGGNPAKAFIAAEIAMAESGGNQYATGQAGERGYWQIHPDHGYLSTYNAYGNARAAVIISNDGNNWSPWTTFTSGAYIGRC